jgi:hypothetical protein
MMVSQAKYDALKAKLEEALKVNDFIIADSKRLYKQLEDVLKAEETGCTRGQYCAGCKHGVARMEGNWEHCYCAYGCEHFGPR